MAEKRNRFFCSPAWVIFLGILTFAAFVFSKELLFYCFVAVYGIGILLFGADLAPIMPLFLLCYITPSPSNNPGQSEEGLFYGASGGVILGLAVLAVLSLLLRITFDKRIGWKKLFKTPRTLLPGILALGIAYLASGIGSRYYAEDVYRNLAFALIQLASILLLYFVFSATVDWKKFDFEFLAWSGLVPGLVVLAELAWIYLTRNVLANGAIDRDLLFTGWGVYNNMGAIIVTAIPFALYQAQRKKHGSIYLILAFILAVGVVFSCSRSSIVFTALIMIPAFVYTLVKTENKKESGITSAILALLLVGAAAVFWKQLVSTFENVPPIADVIDGKLVWNHTGRFEIYKEGFSRFLQNPVFGQGFFHRGYDFPEFSVMEGFSSFFPPRLHNTVIQILASCGIVGLLAYGYHRVQTICLLVKRRSVENTYIGFYLLALLGMSLLDCHFFNVGPILFYSIALAVAEFANPNKKRKRK